MACLYALLFSLTFMSISDAKYVFTIRFYEFRNPLGLQCGACESGGPPACCDDVQRNQNCNLTRPFTCDTRFRFLLRPFRASVETVPTTGYPYFTPSNGGNSEVFNEGPGGFLGLPNPFTIATTNGWTGRIQFHVDVRDRAVSFSGISETLAIINRFPIDLELTLGASFTERTTYTGIYSISGVEFDMSFRVRCSVNYYGLNCTTLCAPMGVYTCDSEGRAVCLQDNHDPATNCTTCLPGWDLEANCTVCLPFYEAQSNCTQCLPGRDISTSCTMCLPGYNPPTNCTECLPNVQCKPTQATPPATTTSTDFSERNSNTSDSCSTDSVVTPATLGGALGLSMIINVTLLIIVLILVTKQREVFAPPLSTPPTSVNEGEGGKGAMNIEIKPNSLYGMTSGSESIKTKPNEVYGISMTTEPSHWAAAATYELELNM